jgi:hypothetical protein
LIRGHKKVLYSNRSFLSKALFNPLCKKGFVMRTSLLLSTLLSIALLPVVAQGEVYKWKDDQGRTVISDTPQPGAGPQKPALPSSTPTPDTAQKNGAPPSLADQELEFRKRQQERQEAAAKAAKEQAENTKKAENCARAKRNLQALESGQRLVTQNEKGEREYINDQQRKQEIARSRQIAQEWCN